MRHGIIRFLWLVPLLSSCRPSPAPAPGSSDGARAGTGGLQVRTDRAGYRADDTVGLTITNHGTRTASFNPCTRTIEHERGGVWSAVQEPGRVCTMEAWIIAPGETRSARADLPAELPPGRYRLVLAFTAEGEPEAAERVDAASAPFTVTR